MCCNLSLAPGHANPSPELEWAGGAVKGRCLLHLFNTFAPSIPSYFQTLPYSPRLMQQTSFSFSATASPRYTRFNDEQSIGDVSTNVYSVEADVEHDISVATPQFIAGSSEHPSSFNPIAFHQFPNIIVNRHNRPSPMPYPALGNDPHTLTSAHSYNHARPARSVLPAFAYGANISHARSSSPRGISHRVTRPNLSGPHINSLNSVMPAETLHATRAHLGQSTVTVQASAASSPVTTAYP